jgi:hypothetical protein
VTFPDNLTVDEAYDAACEVDFQIADVAVAASKAIEEGDYETADGLLSEVQELNQSMKEAAKTGELDEWVAYSDALSEHVEETRQAIAEDREWDAFEGAVEIPELAEWHLGRP